MNSGRNRVLLGGTPVDLLEVEAALALILKRATDPINRPLGVASVNLDHLTHFGVGGRWEGTLHANPGSPVEWLYLLDGAPLVAESQRLTGHQWPRLAGSDLASPVLDAAQKLGLRVGFLGGSEAAHRLLIQKLQRDRPGLRITGMWSPNRQDLSSSAGSERLAEIVAGSGTDILFVGLGKPRQELWIDEFGSQTGASVLLAFGAAVDFLAGTVSRAPQWVRDHGLEWFYRLALEPKRLSRRYLLDGPLAYTKLRTASAALPLNLPESQRTAEPVPLTPGHFTGPRGSVDAAVIVVTYNNLSHVGGLLDSLHAETEDLTLRVLVADNSSTDGTLAFVRAQYPDVISFATGGNVGYSGGINFALARAGAAETIVVLNPDLTVERGSLRRLRERLLVSDAGVVVPRLQNPEKSTIYSLHREPSIGRALGDAILGERVPNRPSWLTGTDRDPESYSHAHTVHWATGAALMIRRPLAEALEWDESFFLYSEETDFCHRVRLMNQTIWFEPTALVAHSGGGSGSSPALNTLLSVNRIRYVRKYHSAAYTTLFHGAVAISEALRFWKPGRKGSLPMLINRRKWSALPGPRMDDQTPFPPGAIIIPAHNEANVIARAIGPLANLAASGQIELIVVCNGCTDDTAGNARRFAGVTVLEINEASKPAALNAGDAAATQWPRLYMDADVQVSPSAVRRLFSTLTSGGPLAARPVVHYDLEGAHPLIQSYYGTRLRLPSVRKSLWSGGVYALSEQGHQRFQTFPNLTADDLFVDRLFAPYEKAVLDGDPVVFRPPRTIKDQLRVLQRVNRGNIEQQGETGEYSTARETLGEVLRSIKGPISACNAIIYAGFALAGRQGETASGEWERDNSSRQIPMNKAIRQ